MANAKAPDGSDILIGENLWQFMQLFQMKFFQDKAQSSDCFFEMTCDQLQAATAAVTGDAENTTDANLVEQLTAALADTDQAAAVAVLVSSLIDGQAGNQLTTGANDRLFTT